MEENCKNCLYKDGSCYPSYNIYSKEKRCKSYELDPYDKITDLEKQLEQAKEIIKEYMRFETMIGTCAFYSEEYEKTKKKAEQFLKESE